MKLIPPEYTQVILTALSILAAWFATWLARRGKKEDTKIAEKGQAFSQMKELADSRGAEIVRLNTENGALRTENERIRDAWEARWSRQMARCRDVTENLMQALELIKQKRGRAAEHEAVKARAVLREHNEDDHDGTDTPDEEGGGDAA